MTPEEDEVREALHQTLSIVQELEANIAEEEEAPPLGEPASLEDPTLTMEEKLLRVVSRSRLLEVNAWQRREVAGLKQMLEGWMGQHGCPDQLQTGLTDDDRLGCR